jgi:peptidoglycan/xylan/chitin deacetylase (PgdA/CDA1 family)
MDVSNVGDVAKVDDVQTHAIPILMYHSIADASSSAFRRFVVSPRDFALHMDHLVENGYQAITMQQLMAVRSGQAQLPERPVVLTFDDAYADFHSDALQILLDRALTASLYVPTHYVGQSARWLRVCGEADRPIVSWSGLEEIAGAGIEIGSHSHSHAQLDLITQEEAWDELSRSRGLLEDHLGLAVPGLAYPFGYWNRHVRGMLTKAGYSYACATAELTAVTTDDVFTFPRWTVTTEGGMPAFAARLARRSTPVARSSSEGLRLLWRTIRRLTPMGGDPRDGRAPESPA